MSSGTQSATAILQLPVTGFIPGRYTIVLQHQQNGEKQTMPLQVK